MFQDISIEELLLKRKDRDITTIDVRSPSEYSDSTIPGSLNIPLFNDEERAEIGTLYKQVSVEAAKERGLEIVSSKLPQFIKQFQAISGEKAVFCWRGGMRSRTTATVLSLMGLRAYRLNGGYRSYRHWVVEELEQYELNVPAFILNGNTGCGKTYILQKLQQDDYPVLDLEGMAAHRGSVFGQVALKPNNQKTFDAFLLERLLEVKNKSYVLYEAESKRIGKVALPDFLMRKKEESIHFWIELPMEERVHQILKDYHPEENKEECVLAFKRIKERIHTPIAIEIENLLQSDRFAEAVHLLLEYYYDLKYGHTAKNIEEDRRVVIQATHPDDAAEQIRAYLSKQGYRA